MSRNDYPETETPEALQAWLDYWGLGTSRTLEGLLNRYLTDTENGLDVPTKNISTLKRWSAAHGWVDRCIDKMAQEAERKEADEEKERARQTALRILEAQTLRAVGVAFIREILERIRAGELKGQPLFGGMVYPEKGRPFRVDGLVDNLPAARQAVEAGHKSERSETGEDAAINRRVEALFETLMDGFDEREKNEIRKVARRVLETQSRKDLL